MVPSACVQGLASSRRFAMLKIEGRRAAARIAQCKRQQSRHAFDSRFECSANRVLNMGLLGILVGLGHHRSIIMLGFGLLWLRRAETAARRAGEGYGTNTPVPVDAAADDEMVREHATAAREFDPAEIHRGHRSDTMPSIVAAALPLIMVVAVNLTMSLVVLPRLDFLFLAEERWGSTSITAVAGAWSVVV